MSLRYYRTQTIQDGGKAMTHLEGIGDSYALCGLDVSGDPEIHKNPPAELPEGRHRVTCQQCNQVIELVKGHLKP